MLQDWYFGCCIGLQPNQIKVLLGQLEALTNCDETVQTANPRLAEFALHGLAEGAVWSQVYALPRVLRWRRLALDAHASRSGLDSYISGLSGLLPKSSNGDAILNLIDSVLRFGAHGSSAAGVAASAVRASCEISDRSESVADTRSPYLDCDRFSPALVTLSCLADDEASFSVLENSHPAPLDALLKRSIKGQFGRLGIVIGLRIMSRRERGSSARSISRVVLSIPDAAPLLEPDLCYWLAHDELSLRRVDTKKYLADELSQFSALFRVEKNWLERNLPAVAKRVEGNALKRFGLTADDKTGDCWRLMCWQWALTSQLDVVDPQDIVGFLETRWRERGENEKRNKGIALTSAKGSQGARLHTAVQNTIEAQGLDQRMEPAPLKGGASLSAHSQTILLSPNFPKSLPSARSFGEARAPEVVWLNMLAGVTIVSQLLRSLPHAFAGTRFLGDLVADAFIRLRITDAEVTTIRNRDRQNRIDALARHLHGHLERLGQGRFGDVEAVFSNSMQESSPAARIHWHEAVFFGSSASSPIHIYAREQLVKAMEALHLQRGGYRLREPDAFRREAVDKARLLWVNILDTDERQRSNPEDLLGKDLIAGRRTDFAAVFRNSSTTDSDEEVQYRLGPDSHLSILMLGFAEIEATFGASAAGGQLRINPFRSKFCISLLAFLGAIRDADGAPDKLLKTVGNLVDDIAGTASADVIDPYVSERLLDALKVTFSTPDLMLVLGSRLPEFWEAACMTILQYGPPYYIDHLISIIYAPGADRSGRQAKFDLQPLLFAGLLRLLRAAEDRLSDVQSDPWRNAEILERAGMLRGFIRKILALAVAVELGRRPSNAEAIVHQYRTWAEQSLAEEASGLHWKCVTNAEEAAAIRDPFQPIIYDRGSIVRRSHGEVYVLSTGQPQWPDGAPYVAEINDSLSINPFRRADGELRALLSSADEIEVLGVVVSCGSPGPKSEARDVAINIGLPTAVPAKTYRAWSAGDACLIQVSLDPQGRPSARGGSPKAYAYDLRGSQIVAVRVQRQSAEGGRSIRLQIVHSGLAVESLDALNEQTPLQYLTEWLPDSLWSHSPAIVGEPESWTSYARVTVSNNPASLQPVDRPLESLFVDELIDGACVWLTLVGDAQDSSAWRFSSRPGWVYLISATDIAAPDRDALEARLSSEGQDGLRVRFCWNEAMEGLSLCIASGHEGFDSAFDDRNLRWRNLFGDGEDARASHAGGSRGGWIVQLPEGSSVDGFPRSWPVRRWIGRQPRPESPTVVVEPSWQARNQRLPWLDATLLSQQLAIQGDREQAFALLSRIARLKVDDRLTLIRPLGGSARLFDQNKTVYRCLADAELLVTVLPESLKMGLWHPNFEPMVRNREVRVEHIDLSRPFPVQISNELQSAFDALSSEDEILGVLTALPSQSAQSDECTICWLGNSSYQPSPISISAGPHRKLGALLTAKRDGRGWRCSIVSRAIQCQAIWTYRQANEDKEGEPVGALSSLFKFKEWSGDSIVELAEGQFSVAMQGRPSGTIASKPPTPTVSSKVGGRVTLVSERGSQCGELAGQRYVNVGTRVTVRSVEYVPTRLGENQFVFQRRFNLGVLEDVRRPTDKPDVSKERLIQEELVDLAERRQLVAASPLEDGLSVEIESARLVEDGVALSKAAPRSWRRKIPFGKDVGPFFPTAAFVTGRVPGHVVLQVKAGEVVASARSMPAAGLGEFKQELNLVSDDIYEPARPLYYCGAYDRSILGEEKRTLHVFEWALGSYIELPEDRIKWKNVDFSALRLTFLFGDAVTRLRILKSNVVDDDWTLSIQAFEQTGLCDLHDLREQAQNNVLAVVEAEWSRERLTVKNLRGFNRNDSTESMRNFRGLRAVLNSGSLQRLNEALAARESANISVLGRLDLDDLAKMRGSKVVFNALDPVIEPGNENCLKNGDVVFLSPIRMRRGRNDWFLDLSYSAGDEANRYPLQKIASPRNDLSEVTVLRRQFSARQDRLAALAPTLSRTTTLLIPVAVSKRRDGHISGSIIADDEPKIMMRNDLVLKDMVQSPRPVHAIVVRHDYDKLILELLPAVFVALETHQFGLAGTDTGRPLEKGTIVLVELSDVKDQQFRLTASGSGHLTFVDGSRDRLAVALPTNLMFKQSPYSANWRSGALVSIGDLPDITAVPAPDVTFQALSEWMRKPHPKLAWLRRTDDRVLYLPCDETVAPHDAVALCLSFVDETSFGPLVYPVGEDEKEEIAARSHSSVNPQAWLQLTFGDRSAADSARSVRQALWQYHDDTSICWTESAGAQPIRLPSQSSAHGPLMFKLEGDALRLRYRQDEMARFGFSVDALVEDLARAGATCRYVVAYGGEARNLSSDKLRSLWIELSPGRIAELPPALCIWETDTGGIALQSFAWEKVSSGDSLTLSLMREEDPMAPDRIRVSSWTPGRRGAFASRRLIAPVHQDHGFDGTLGLLTLGARGWALTLPVLEAPEGELMVLDGNNALAAYVGESPDAGDTVILELAADRTVMIAGFPGWTVRARSDGFWPGKNRQLFGEPGHLVELLELLGGSVAVHVRSWNAGTRLCTFCRDHGIDVLTDQSLLLSQLIGWHSGLRSVIIAIGSGLHTIEVSDLVEQAPDASGSQIIDALIETRENVWLRWENKKPVFGFRSVPNTEFSAVAITTVEAGGEGEFGIVCRVVGTGRYVWLGSSHASLASSLTRDEFERCLTRFRKDQLPLQLSICRLEDGRFSATGSKLGNERLKRLRLGSEVKVRLLAEAAESGGLLAWIEDLNAIVRGRRFWKKSFNQSYAGEISVLRHGRQPIVEVVPSGERRIPLDLPTDAIDAAKSLLGFDGEAPQKGRLVTSHHMSRLSDPALSPEPFLPVLQMLAEIRRLSERDETGVAAARLIVAAGQAALRSFHIATLSRLWLDADGERPQTPFWRRRAMQTFRDVFFDGHNGVKAQVLERVGYLLETMEIREPSESLLKEPTNGLLLAAALAASVGLLPRPRTWYRLVASNKQLATLLAIVRVYPVRTDSPGSISAQYVDACVAELGRRLDDADLTSLPLLKGNLLSG